MIIEKKTEYVVLKLSSAEEIIAKIVEDSSTFYVVQSPRSLFVDQNGSAAFTPCLMMVDPKEKVKIYKSSIMIEHFFTSLQNKVLAEYIKQTSSIAVPTSNLIV